MTITAGAGLQDRVGAVSATCVASGGGSSRLGPVGENLTREQHDQLARELAELEGPRRAEVVEAIAVARGHGDLSENFEYHAAKNEQGLLERKISILRSRLEDAVIVEGGDPDVVGVGSRVVIEDGDGAKMEVE